VDESTGGLNKQEGFGYIKYWGTFWTEGTWAEGNQLHLTRNSKKLNQN